MFSDTDHYSLSDRGGSPAEERETRSRTGEGKRGSAFTSPNKTVEQHDVTELRANPTDNTDNYSFSDLSPIKLVYHNNGTISEAHRFGDVSFEGRGTVAVSSPNHHKPPAEPVSNPFYVLRSVQEAFQGCKYLLSCLRGRDICRVNISTTGHIHHYRGVTVSLTMRGHISFVIMLYSCYTVAARPRPHLSVT